MSAGTEARATAASMEEAESRRTTTEASLHDVFMTYTGRSLDDDVEADETE